MEEAIFYDIKTVGFFHMFSIYSWIFLAGMFGVFFYYIATRKKQKPEQQAEVEKMTDFQKLFGDLEKHIVELSDDQFYKEITSIFRLFLNEKEQIFGVETATFREIEKQIPTRYKNVFKDLYFEEYQGKSLSGEEREKVVDTVKSIILQ